MITNEELQGVSKTLEGVDVQPEVAAKNIENSGFFEINPDAYSLHADDFDKEINSLKRVPANLEENTKDFLGQSDQHAGLAQDDVEKMNFIEKRLKYYKQRIVDLPNLRRQSNELWNKRITDGTLSQEDQNYLDELDFFANEMEQNTYGIDGDIEKLLVEGVSGVGDMLRSYWDNKEIGASIVAGGAGLGALGGFFVPVPGATVAGAVSGASAAIPTAAGVVGFLDGYKQTRAEVFKELTYAVDDQGNPLALDESTKKTAAIGVGLLSGVASGFAGRALAKANPLFAKVASGKAASQLLKSSPAVLARMKILGSIIESGITEGSEEAFQEVIQIVGVNLAKVDESEASFLNAIDVITDTLTNTETWKQAGYAGAVGGTTGGLMAAGGGAVGYRNLRSRYEEAQQTTARRSQILEKQNQLLEVSQMVNSTKVKELAPNEMSKFKEKLYSKIGLDQDYFFKLEDIQLISQDPEAREAIYQTLDKTGQLNKIADQLNTPIMLKENEVLDIIEKMPTFSDYLRMDPDGESPAEVRSAAKEYSDRLNAAEAKRTELLNTLGVGQEMTPEMQAEIDSLLNPPETERTVSNEIEFYDDIRFEPIEGIVSEKEVQELNTIELGARLEVAKALKAEVDTRYQNFEDRTTLDIMQKRVQTEIKELDNELRILDNFQDRRNKSEGALAIVNKHKRKGFSPVAIDPDSLPADLKKLYIDQPEILKKLNKRKVFVKGGLDIRESAAVLGVDDPANLLKILAETPTRQQIKQRREQENIAVRNRVRQTILPSRMAARDEAFTNHTRALVKQMEYLVSREWPTMKRGIIKIAGKPPKVQELNARARDQIYKTKVKDLNPRRFEQGEINSRKKAMQNWVKSEFEQAYKNIQASALNVEMRKESINAREQVLKFNNFWERVATESNQNALKKAGMLEAMQEFTDVFKMGTSTRGLTELNAFNNFIKKQAELGNFTPAIPDRLNDVTQSARDMTFEQYKTITEMGEYILSQAKLKNKLLTAQEKRNELRTAEKIAENIQNELTQHPNFDPEKTKDTNSRYFTTTEYWSDKLKTALSSISSIKSIVLELDNYKFGGYFQQIIGDPIKQARTNKRLEISDIEASDTKIVEAYGMKEFKKMFNTFIEIPEFADRNDLGDGKGRMRKIDLLTMLAYMGDPEGRKALENFTNSKAERIPFDTIQKVLDRELTEKDAALVQSMMVDRFKRFEQRSFDLHKRTSGVEPTMVKGVPFVHRGKEYPGGYYPIRRKMVPDEVRGAKYLESVKNSFNNFSGETDESFFARMRTAEMTEQGRLKERTGSDRPLDLTFENLFDFTEEAVHDLNFRETGIDILKVLKDPINVKNMKSVLGTKKFVALLNHVKDVVSKTTEQESTLFGNEYRLVNGFIDKVHSLHTIKTIGFNLTSSLVQFDALLNIGMRAGFKSNLYLMKTAKKLVTNPTMWHEYVKIAEQMNPDIKLEKDGIDNAVIKSSYEWIPSTATFFKNYASKSAGAISTIKDLQQKVIDSSFFLLRETDRANRIIATLALSEQFLNGDIEGYSKERLAKMSDKEKADTLKSVVRQIIDSTLTASAPEDKTALEKNPLAKLFLRYWTDRRSRLNTMVSTLAKTKTNLKRGEYGQAVGNMGGMAITLGASTAIISAIRNGAGEFLERLEDEEDRQELAGDVAWHFLSAPFQQFADMTPVIDNINYTANMEIRGDYRNVSTPFFGVMSDVAMGKNALLDVLRAARQGEAPTLSKVDRKALLANAGYLVGGAPTNAIARLAAFASSDEISEDGSFFRDVNSELLKEIKLFKENYGRNPDAAAFIEDLEKYQEENLQVYENDVENIIPPQAKEAIKQSNNWDTYNPDTGAAGIYQFTEDRWNEIMEKEPSLGLTEDGRVSKDSSEQELAMTWAIQDNTRGLLAYEIPVNNANLLGAHEFGFDNFASIYEAKDSQKLSEVLGEQASNPVFKDFTTVGDVKKYLSSKVSKFND